MTSPARAQSDRTLSAGFKMLRPDPDTCGLAISRQLIERMGGEIHATSAVGVEVLG